MKGKRNIFYLVAALAVLFALAVRPSQAAPTAGSPVAEAWRLAQENGVYQYATTIVQTTRPLPRLENAGRSTNHDYLYIEGEANAPEETMTMKLWSEGGSTVLGQGAIELKVENGQAFGRNAGGQWESVNGSVTDLFAPGRDPLGFLHAATNITLDQTSNLQSPISTYRFDLDGAAFALFMRDQLEADMEERGELPPGVNLDTASVYQDMTGSGEIWVSTTTGLPVRLLVQATFPPAEYDQSEVEITTDFSNWGTPMVTLSQRINRMVAAVDPVKVSSNLLITVSLLLMAMVVLLYGRSRKVYKALALSFIFIMLASPLMQGHHASAYSEREEARLTEQEERQEVEREVSAIKNPTTNWNPHTSPFLSTRSEISSYDVYTVSFEHSPLTDDGSDSDDDGITDSLEFMVGTIWNDADSDDDGLADGVEYFQLGLEARAGYGQDTDGDGLPDGLEVAGFSYNSQQWYTDPAGLDTNFDKIPDGVECMVNDSDQLVCPDADNDGTPNVFDEDNDNDGVPDLADLDPHSAVGNPATGIEGGVFSYSLAQLTPNEPVYLDFQLRPSNPDHLWYSLNVLDWPSNDLRGQVQRVNDSTFLSSLSPADQARASADLGDGDMRLIPMLEIEMPYEAGRQANLPVASPPITATSPITTWINQAEMDSFGITTRYKNSSGDIVAYLPLNLTHTDQGNVPVAFNGRMLYQPSQAGWGPLHSARLVWLVQVITDSCTPTDEDFEPNRPEEERRAKWCAKPENVIENGPTIVHLYDDDWHLTGLQVREDRGVKAAIAFQDPTFSDGTPAENYLWALAQGLDFSFTASPDDGSNNRTFTIEDIAQRFDNRQNGSATEDERWGIPAAALLVESYFTGLEHQADIATLPLSRTNEVLETYFTPSGIHDATLLFAYEERYRSVSLDFTAAITPTNGDTWQGAYLDGSGLNIEVSDVLAPEAVTAGMRWAPFRYDTGLSRWEGYPIADYWADKEGQWQTILSTTFTDPGDLAGALMVASTFYLNLHQGISGLVEVDNYAADAGWQLNDNNLKDYLALTQGPAASGIVNRWTEITRSVQLFVEAGRYTLEELGVINMRRLAGFKLRDLANVDLTQNVRVWRGEVSQEWLNDLEKLDRDLYSRELGRNRLGSHHGQLFKLGLKYARLGMRLNTGATYGAMLVTTLQLAYSIGTLASPSQRALVLELIFASATVVLNALLTINVATQVVLTIAIGVAQSGRSLLAVTARYLRLFGSFTLHNLMKNPLAVASFIITAAVTIGIFIYQMVSQGVQAGSLAFNLALANLIAGLVVAAILVALSLFPIFGQAIAWLITLIDAVINLICLATGANQGGGFAAKWICPGITGLLTQAIQFFIYDQNPIVDLGNAGRLNMAQFDVDLVIPEKGIAVGNGLEINLIVGSALYKRGPDSYASAFWAAHFGDSYARQSSLRYQVLREQTPINGSQQLNDMAGLWVAPPVSGWSSNANFVYSTTVANSQPISLTNDGVNVEIPDLYLAEGQVIPVQECIHYGILPICWIREQRGNIYLNLGQKLIFDVFPETLDDFFVLAARPNGAYALNWMTNVAAPNQADADGDGLRSPAVGGNDPNDSLPDSDGDNLSDFFEVQLGTPPTQADGDSDGLNDQQEALFGTNPYKDDSDNDGLPDGEEVTGWAFVYDFNGSTPLTTWVRSDPLAANTDNDDYLDSLEKAYGFNPNVASSSDVLSLISTLGDNDTIVRPTDVISYQVEIENALRNRYAFGLLELDFPAALAGSNLDPQAFIIEPSQTITRTGTVTVSPLATTQAVSLTNIAGSAPVDLDAEIAGRTLWLHLEETAAFPSAIYQDSTRFNRDATCISHVDFCPTNNVTGFRRLGLDFDGLNDFLAIDGSPRDLGFALDSYTVRAWVYADSWTGKRSLINAETADFVVGFDSGRPVIEYDGVQVLSPNVLSTGRWYQVTWRFEHDNNRHTLYVDGVEQTTTTAITFPYEDLLNESSAVMFLSRGSLVPAWDTFDGRLDEIEIFPFALAEQDIPPVIGIGQVYYDQFEETPSLPTTGWSDNSQYLNQIDCAPDAGDPGNYHAQCPDAGVAGFAGNAFRFDNSVDTTILTVSDNPNLDLSRGQGRFAISLWLKKQQDEGGWALGNYNYQTSADSGYPSIQIDGDSLRTYFGLNPNRCTLEISGLDDFTDLRADLRWQHVVVSFDGQDYQAYLNNQQIGSVNCVGKKPTATSSFYVGNRGNSPGSGFRGDLDELRFFNHPLDANQIADLFWDTLPILEMRFNEAPARTEFQDISLTPHNGLCGGTICPTSGVQGRFNQALLFDGTDDFFTISPGMTQLGLADHSFTIAAWVKLDQVNNQYVIGTWGESAANTFAVGVDANHPLMRIGNNTYLGSDIVGTSQWNHIVWRNEYSDSPPTSRLAMYLNGTLTYSATHAFAVPGAAATLYSGVSNGLYFDGMMDHLQVFRQALNEAQIQDLIDQSPAALYHLDEPIGSVTFANVADPGRPFGIIGGGAHVTPDIGVKGKQYQGVAFDGINDFLIAGPNPNLFTGDYSMGLWVNPTSERSTAQTIFHRFENGSFLTQITVGLDHLNRVTYGLSQSDCSTLNSFTSQSSLLGGTWNHVLVTYDSSLATMSIYINGRLDSSQASPGGLCAINAIMHLGTNAQENAAFGGTLDELFFMNEVMSDRDIAEMVNYQRAWYDTSYSHDILIDADNPTVALDATAPYLANEEIMLAIQANDPTSGVALVEYNVNNSGWYSATRDGSAWLFLFQPTGEGSYDIDVRATDVAGNVGLNSSAAVQVDNSSPVLGTINAELPGNILPAFRNNPNESWDVVLAGLVSGSGSPVDTIYTTLVPTNTIPVNGGSQPATIFLGNWFTYYPFNDRPNGVYTLTVEATDAVGNSSSRTVLANIDGTPPTADVRYTGPSTLTINSQVVLTGTVNDDGYGGVSSEVAQVEIGFQPSGLNDRSSAEYMTSGRLLHVPLDELGGFSDRVNNYPAGCIAAACPLAGVKGYYGNAADFDGSDDLVEVANINSSAATSAFSLGAYVYPEAGTDSSQTILALTTTGGTMRHLLLYDHTTQRFVYNDSVTGDQSSSNTFAPGNWYHILATVNAAGNGTLYINGLVEDTFSTTVRPPAVSDLQIGNSGSGRWAGLLDDVILYAGALTAAEVAQFHRGYYPAMHLPLDEAAFLALGPVEDSSRFSSEFVYASDNTTFAVPGAVGAGALPYDGGSYSISGSGPAADLSTGRFSQLAWVFPEPLDNDIYSILSNSSGLSSGQNGLRYPEIMVINRTHLRVGFGDGSTWTPYTTGSVLTENAWNFVAVTFDGTTYAIYVNGELVDSTNSHAGRLPVVATSFSIGIGRDSVNRFFRGFLDELSIYRQVLDEETIAALYHQGWQPTELAGSPVSSWYYTTPVPLNGPYQLQLRSTDSLNNQSYGSQDQGRWDGFISLGLDSDIQVTGFTANGSSTITVTYNVLTSTVAPFNLNFLRSADALYDVADTILYTTTVSSPADLTPGSHSLVFTLGTNLNLVNDAGETDNDYYLLATADIADNITELDSDPHNEDNTAVFQGVYHQTGQAIFIHGREAQADTIDLARSGSNIRVIWNGTTYFLATAGVSTIRVRSHGQNDTVDATKITSPATTTTYQMGGAGNDTLRGGANNDVLVGGPGNDTLSGTGNNDRASYFDSPAGVAADLALGSAGTDGWGGSDSLLSIKNLEGSEFNDTLNGNSANNFITGRDGADLINGRDGYDTLYGGLGVDTINGGNQDDDITAGDGDDILDGGAGNDTIAGENGNDTIYGGANNDSLLGHGGNDIIYGGAGNDGLYGGSEIGVSNDDTLYGEAGTDTIYGGVGNDTVSGGANGDTLFGGDGNDSLHANTAACSNDGAADALNGGNNSDSATYSPPQDTITAVESSTSCP